MFGRNFFFFFLFNVKLKRFYIKVQLKNDGMWEKTRVFFYVCSSHILFTYDHDDDMKKVSGFVRYFSE